MDANQRIAILGILGTLVAAVIAGVLPVVSAPHQKIAILGLVGTLVAAVIAAVLLGVITRYRKAKGRLRASIGELLLPNDGSQATKTFKHELSQAREVRMCGYSPCEFSYSTPIPMRLRPWTNKSRKET